MNGSMRLPADRITRAPSHFLFRRPRAHRHTAARTIAVTVLAAFALIGSTGCGGDGGGPAGPAPSIAGAWSGNAYAGVVGFNANFTQNGESVGGTGRFSSPLASGDFIVSGTVKGSDVDLVLTSVELGATVFHGRFTSANRIRGTFDPSGSYETELTLNRQ
jgi:hypothetical protein